MPGCFERTFSAEYPQFSIANNCLMIVSCLSNEGLEVINRSFIEGHFYTAMRNLFKGDREWKMIVSGRTVGKTKEEMEEQCA